MITKDIQDKAWGSLPVECRQAFQQEYKYRVDFGSQEDEWVMEMIFGKRNLTSESIPTEFKSKQQEIKEQLNDVSYRLNNNREHLNILYFAIVQRKRSLSELYSKRRRAETWSEERMIEIDIEETLNNFNQDKFNINRAEKQQKELKQKLRQLNIEYNKSLKEI